MRSTVCLLALIASGSWGWAATPTAIVPNGSDVLVRVDETINTRTANEGRIYAAELDQDLLDINGGVAVPKGSMAELLVRQAERSKELVLDLQSVFIGGRRNFVTADNYGEENTRPAPGKNRRTAQMTGGGAIVGSILGALAGGGKGAAIGGASRGAMAGTLPVLTRGRAVKVPAETVVTFHLEKSLRLYEVE